MTNTERFTLALALMGFIVACIGWLAKTLWAGQTKAVERNTDAVTKLTEMIARLDSRIAQIERQSKPRQRWWAR